MGVVNQQVRTELVEAAVREFMLAVFKASALGRPILMEIVASHFEDEAIAQAKVKYEWYHKGRQTERLKAEGKRAGI